MIRVTNKKYETMIKTAIVIFAGITSAIALNGFLTPANVFASGITGIAQLLSSFLYNSFRITIDTGIFIFLFNIPVAVLGVKKLGKEATFYSILTVISVSIFTVILPVAPISDNPLMNAIIGGVLIGIGGGLALKFGFSAGGIDILSLIVAKTTGRSVGTLSFAMNFVVIIIAGLMFDWESALYTIISIFCMTQVFDALHTRYQKITAMIITNHSESVLKSIEDTLVRGMTLIPMVGGYSKKEGTMVMVVITRYELYDLEQAVVSVDPNAFINIVPTQSVIGQFWNEDQQKDMRNKAL